MIGKIQAPYTRSRDQVRSHPTSHFRSNSPVQEHARKLSGWGPSSEGGFRWKHPHHYKHPDWYYPPGPHYRHRDFLSRVANGAFDDRYISPWDGRIKKLVVQCTEDVYAGKGTSSYARTYIRNVGNKALRLANWPASHYDYEMGRYDGEGGTGLMIAKWVPACLALTIMVKPSECVL